MSRRPIRPPSRASGFEAGEDLPNRSDADSILESWREDTNTTANDDAQNSRPAPHFPGTQPDKGGAGTWRVFA